MFDNTARRLDGEPPTPLAGDDQAIDFAHLFRMTLGDHSLEREVLALFDRQAEMLIGRMAGSEPAEVAALAHTLKGSARGIGAFGVATAAESVEAAVRARDDVEGAVEALWQAALQTRETIANHLRAR